MKKLLIFLIIFIMSPLSNGWAGPLILTVYEFEVDQRSFSRYFNILEEFYQDTKPQVRILSKQLFFRDPDHPTDIANKALKKIIQNHKTSIIADYLTELNRLKTDLLELEKCFKDNKTASDLDDKKVENLLSYSQHLRLILQGLGVK